MNRYILSYGTANQPTKPSNIAHFLPCLQPASRQSQVAGPAQGCRLSAGGSFKAMGCTASSVKRGGGASDDAYDNVFPGPVRTEAAQRESAAADQEDAAAAPNPAAQQADQQTSSTSSAASRAAAAPSYYDLFSLQIPTMNDLGVTAADDEDYATTCLLYTSPSPRDLSTSRMPSSA